MEIYIREVGADYPRHVYPQLFLERLGIYCYTVHMSEKQRICEMCDKPYDVGGVDFCIHCKSKFGYFLTNFAGIMELRRRRPGDKNPYQYNKGISDTLDTLYDFFIDMV